MTAPDNRASQATLHGHQAEVLSEKRPVVVSPSLAGSEEHSSSSVSNSAEDDAAEQTPPRRMSLATWIAVVLSLNSAVFLFALDNTVVANVQPSIIRDLGSIDKLPWLAVGYGLGSAATSLTWGRLYGLLDCKKLYIASVIFFEVGSAVCGAAPTFNAMVVGRVLAGIGGAGAYIGAINMLASLTTKRERAFYMLIVGTTYCCGNILGPIVGGAFADSKATWRWAFYINLVVAALVAPTYIFLIPSVKPSKDGQEVKVTNIRQFDVIGTVLFAGASVSLVMAIAFGGATYAWNSGQIIGLFVCTGVCWLAFITQQRFCILTTRKSRIFPVQFLRSLQLCLLFAQVALCIAALFVFVYFIPLYFQFVKGDSPIISGAKLLPFVFCTVAGGSLNALGMAKYGLYMPWFLAGGIFVTIGSSLIYAKLTVATSFAELCGYSVILALGTGFFAQAPYTVSQAKVTEEELPEVTAFISTGQITGIVLSLSVASSIFLNRATDKIVSTFPGVPPEQIKAAIGGAGSQLLGKLPAPVQEEIWEIVVDSIADVFIQILAGGAAAILLALLLKRERLQLDGMMPFGL